MSQPELDYGRDYRVSEAHRAVLRAVNDAVDATTLIIAAGACGCRTAELSDVLTGRDHRYLRIEWVLAIMDIAPVDFRLRIAAALLAWIGYRPEALKPLKPEEKLARLEQRIAAKFGHAGLELVEENRK